MWRKCVKEYPCRTTPSSLRWRGVGRGGKGGKGTQGGQNNDARTCRARLALLLPERAPVCFAVPRIAAKGSAAHSPAPARGPGPSHPRAGALRNGGCSPRGGSAASPAPSLFLPAPPLRRKAACRRRKRLWSAAGTPQGGGGRENCKGLHYMLPPTTLFPPRFPGRRLGQNSSRPSFARQKPPRFRRQLCR